MFQIVEIDALLERDTIKRCMISVLLATATATDLLSLDLLRLGRYHR